MKRALLLCAVAVGGCSNSNTSISIIQMGTITPPACVASAMAGGTALSRGTLDVSLITDQGYIAAPIIRNNLLTSMTTGSGAGLEYNGITITGADVSLQTPDGAALNPPTGKQSFFYPASGVRLDPGGVGVVFVEVLRADVAKSLAGNIPATGVYTVVANMRPVGMKGDQQVVGEAMPFPIDLCSGCLIQPVNACPLPKGTPAPMNNCLPQQDVRNVCCTDTAGQLLCGTAAPVASM